MITKRERKLSQSMIIVQVIISALLFLGLELIYPQQVVSLSGRIFFLSQIVLIWSLLFYKFRLGIIFRVSSFSSMIRGYLVTISLGGGLLLIEYLIVRFSGYYTYSVYYFIRFLILDLLVLIAFKLLFYNYMKFLRRKGGNSRSIIIIADTKAKTFIDEFIEVRDWGYRIHAIITPDNNLIEKYNNQNVVMLENQEKLENFVLQNPIDDIFYCLPVKDNTFNLEKIILHAKETGVTLHLMQPDYLQNINDQRKSDICFGECFVTYQTTPSRYLSLKIKDAFDLLFSALALLILAPLYLIISLLIKIEDGGPVFFVQERIGLNGRRFKCYKFRSMVVNAESMVDQLQELNESDGPTFKIKNDPRTTRIGRLLRKTSLDELPQFYNVIKGDMSVVGPRPPLLREVQQYERTQLRRLSMRPGITCKWQVWGRNEVTFDEWMRMDLNYIDNWSLRTDAKIVIATIGVIFKANGR